MNSDQIDIKDVDIIHFSELEKDIDILLNEFPLKKLDKEKCYSVNEDLTRYVILIKVLSHCKEIMIMLEKEYKELFKMVNDRSGWKRHRKYYILLKFNMEIFFKILKFLIHLTILSIEKDVSLKIWEFSGSFHASIQKNEFKKAFDTLAAWIGSKSHKIETLSNKLAFKYQQNFEELKKSL